MRRRDLLSDLRALLFATRAGIVTLPDAAAALQVSRREATLRMRALVRFGALRRVSRGLFFIIPIKTKNPGSERPYDGAVVASAHFHPCYIGGWSAADAWDLLLSYKRETFVVTSSRVRVASARVVGFRFRLAHVPERLITGPDIVPRSNGAWMSDPERTLVDALRSPAWLGGARSLAQAFREHRRSNRWDPDRLVETLLRAGNGAAIKRLAALDKVLELGIADVLDSVADRRTRGIVALEPGAGAGGRTDTRCGVRLNVDLDEADVDDWDP